MRPVTLRLLAGLSLAVVPLAAAAPADAPPDWLSQVQGGQAMRWVAAENRRSLGILHGDPRFAQYRDAALTLAQTPQRIPQPEQIAGRIYNFWQDRAHVRGLWRSASTDSYRRGRPDWRTDIDLDALARREHANWVWKGTVCEEAVERRCLVSLSDGGEDASTLREFDLADDRFVTRDGFRLPRSKQQADWQDADTLLVARDWGAGTMTSSGYGFVVKSVQRGRPLGEAREIFRGKPSDVQVTPESFVDGDGHRVVLLERGVDFFSTEHNLLTASGLRRLDLPPRSTVEGLVAGRIVVEIDQAWTARGLGPVASGSLIGLSAADPGAPPSLIVAPGPRQTVNAAAVSRGALVAEIYDNVRGQAWVFRPRQGGWQGERLALPADVSVRIASNSPHLSEVWLGVTGFLTPSTLWHADTATGQVRQSYALPAQFDAAPYIVDQFEATSADGTHVPYFLVHRRDMRLNGRNPTELYAYGGFQVSMTPRYTPILGRLWLDRGGVYALANIRGGGEFGPEWHMQATKTHRERAWDDFAAVARDLIARRVTSPRRLGIRGGSNGGLLMGAEFTRHPELWHAVVIEVPLLDMLHYETMAAGASWVGEYGSVANPDERAFLARTSPLASLRPDRRYPLPFLFTTTKDDRVGPVHARRFAWTMERMGLPFLYYEETEGGHAAGANLREVADEQALEYTYLARMLME